MWALIFFFALITIIFVAFAIFYPEWVGITGKKARQIQAHQKENSDEAAPKEDHFN